MTWKIAQNAAGKTYYYNKQTKETSWKKPADFSDEDEPPPPPPPETEEPRAPIRRPNPPLGVGRRGPPLRGPGRTVGGRLGEASRRLDALANKQEANHVKLQKILSGL
eukprot:CAMPEP_0170741242 /NCGR_PEP_ID=MMETSP0437-20130122/6115_1 /TAXON_ID=0 /ORGANISM="Sexangularia sp." /LENGTH=107 /DNA_ID=CAMNT_0011079801 /DNA_START=104 /DNA_END=427 /DNA_ORIENTATION=+